MVEDRGWRAHGGGLMVELAERRRTDLGGKHRHRMPPYRRQLLCLESLLPYSVLQYSENTGNTPDRIELANFR